MEAKIIYTLTDEAPMLATYSLLPIVRSFAKAAGINLETRDISLAHRILAAFPDYLNEKQRVPDSLAELGNLVNQPDANIIKLPNISASIPQIQSAVAELQAQGFEIPDFPEDPQNKEDTAIRQRYDVVKGSAVNPVLREGNSDRRAPSSVKRYARRNPHSMGEWNRDSKTHVATMQNGDFYGSEKSLIVGTANTVRIEFVDEEGEVRVLKEKTPLLPGEIIDTAVMSVAQLRAFLEEQMQDAKNKGVLFSIHLKATMMKVSDPVIFGHAVSVYFRNVFEKHAETLRELGVDQDHGLGDLEAKLSALPESKQAEIKADIQHSYSQRPKLAMVNSDKGITNLHVPSDIIIDASMPAAIRNSGKIWGADGALHDMKAVIPDRSYAGVYQAVIDYCKENGAFDPATMGTVSNVGLMAQKAEEYGSHDKTFVSPGKGIIRVVNEDEMSLLEHQVESGDIFRMCQAKDAPIRNWVELAVSRARATGNPTVFWLDEQRAHDRMLIKKVKTYLKDHDTQSLEIRIMSPSEACMYSLKRAGEGKDTVSVTGNVLRDYLTDLFPILELGTSAKMLSIVPLMAGGGLFETGAGGSAPKHVQQFVHEGHLRWDSLGEFLALTVSLEQLADVFHNDKARILGEKLDMATGRLLDAGKSPSRKVGELDNRGSHFYLALYWAQALAAGDNTGAENSSGSNTANNNDTGQVTDNWLTGFKTIANRLAENEKLIVDELKAAQGKPVDIGGYYHPDVKKITAAMRPSELFNSIIDSV